MKTGSFTPAGYANYIYNGIILLILSLFFIDYFIDFGSELQIISLLLFAVATAIFVLRYKQLLLYGLSLLIPVSVPLAVFGGSKISLPSEAICALLFAFFAVKIILDKRPDRSFLKHPLTLLILADLAWLLITSVFSQLLDVSLKRFIIRLFYYVAFYYFYYELFKQDAKNIKRVFTLHCVGFLVPIVYATVIHARLGFTTVGSQQISAPFYFDHTIYGACLVFFIPFLVFCAFNKQYKKTTRWWYMVLLLVFLAAVVLSYSRAAWLSLLMALAVYFILKKRIRVRYLFYSILPVIAALALNWNKISVSLKENKGISHSNDVAMHFKSISNVNTDASNKERINRWKCALRMFADKPLIGFGPGTYQFFYGQYQQRQDLTRISTFNGTKGHAHSEYLNYLSETGLPGLLIFTAIIIFVCTRSLRLIHVYKGFPEGDIALYTFSGLVTFFIHGFFNGFLEFEKVAMPVFISYAVLTFLDLRSKTSSAGV